MADLATLEQQLETLKAQARNPVDSLSYEGRSVRYRGVGDIQKAISTLEKEIARVRGGNTTRRIRVITSKGY
ncbi:phage head-tail joining protein [Magnetococcales bacterium HHB-1]